LIWVMPVERLNACGREGMREREKEGKEWTSQQKMQKCNENFVFVGDQS